MAKYFLDTTVLAEALLKERASGSQIRKVLSTSESELPIFAIRELKAGPMSYFVWAHNKLATTKSFVQTLGAVQAMSRTPRRYLTSTAIEAIKDAMKRSIAEKTPATLASKYGPSATMDFIHADELRLAIRRRVRHAWSKRHSVANRAVIPLSCYQEVSPVEERGLLSVKPCDCIAVGECSLASRLRGAPATLEKLLAANDMLPMSRESQKRGRALKDLARKPKQPLSEAACRDLGDALFAFFAPDDFAILTTNVKDHGVLAGALGKSAITPNAVQERTRLGDF